MESMNCLERFISTPKITPVDCTRLCNHGVAGSGFSSKSKCCMRFVRLKHWLQISCWANFVVLGVPIFGQSRNVKNTILYILWSLDSDVGICTIGVFRLRQRNWDRSGCITPSKLWRHKMNFGKETRSGDSA